MIPGKRETRKVVYFVRHGQSVANVTPVFQSEDSPLSATGKKQAQLIAGRISQIDFDALISSPSMRTKETAEFISHKTGKPIVFSDLFVERIKPSSVSGKPHDDKEASKRFHDWETSLHVPNMRVEDGENFDDITARAAQALSFLYNRPEKRIVVVTHGFFLRALLAKVLNGDSLTSKNFRSFLLHSIMDNTGLSAIKYIESEKGSAWNLWIHNDHAHLAE
ncbi:MAG: histidine phosphatase family protein [Patescibacteria group bacterium]|nr:histidine phosphatase family protein [Patescibacteria group bacterium]